ncbi:MAG: Ig-like domain-containing protein [Burkholderiaceae bacterium]
MATIIEAIAADGRVARIELAGKDLSFPVDPGVRYRVIDGDSGEMPDALSLRREGGDLLVNGLPDGERVRIEGFFTDCGTESCEFSLGESGESIRPGSEPVAALKDGSFLMWASEGTVSTLPEAPESEFNWRPVAGIGAGLAVIGAGAGGGGGGGGPADTTAPDAPAIKTPAATNNPFPSISGTAEPGSTITLTIDIGGTGNRVSYSTTVNGDGQWVIDTAQQTPFAGAMPATGLPADQPSTLQAIATDSAGLSSTVSSSQISIDLTPPEQVAKITAAASDAAAPLDDQGVAINTNGAVLEPGPLADGSQTNDRSPTFSGTIDAALADGDRVVIYRDGALVGEATLNGLQWTFTDPNAPAGTHVYEARTADAAGNVAASGNTFTLTIDGTAPLSPVVATVAGDDIIDFLEADAGVSISGTAEAGSRVRITWGDVVRLVQVDGTGQFTTSYSREQLPGDGAIPIAAVAIDSFGNQSPVALHPVNLVTHLPDAPVINTANGILAGSPMAINALEAANIAITGTATPGNRVSLTFTPDNGGPALRFEGDAGLNGQFSVPIARNALPDGQYQVRAVSTDIVGNSATGNQNLSVLVDTRAHRAGRLRFRHRRCAAYHRPPDFGCGHQ